MRLTPKQTKICKALIRFCKKHNITLQSDTTFYLSKLRIVKCNDKVCHVENPETKLRGVFVTLTKPLKETTRRGYHKYHPMA